MADSALVLQNLLMPLLSVLFMLAVAGYLLATLYGEDRSFFLPGPTTHGHYQIELKCNACHLESGGINEQSCIDCHGAELKAVNDSHPAKKFRDPRNADLLRVIDATRCTTCHEEHRPGKTTTMGLTLTKDYCFNCHSDIGEERETHKGLGFMTCQTAGCHNFHDNTALYENFLEKHLEEPEMHDIQQLPARDFAARWAADHPGKAPLAASAASAPADVETSPELIADWAASAHARAAINCTGCHQPESAAQWIDRPTQEQCATCHETEVAGWLASRHGMRVAQGLSPMRPDLARLPMHDDAAHRELSCTSCHADHRFDTRFAAVEACMQCHNDAHTNAYLDSKHYALWQAELKGIEPAGTGVSCATCHLPRVEVERFGEKHIEVDHNQNNTLRPNEKMIRAACMNCHGVGFAIDALADPDLVAGNFQRRPETHIESIDWVQKRHLAHSGNPDFN